MTLSCWWLCWLHNMQDVRVWGPWKSLVQVALTIFVPRTTLRQVGGAGALSQEVILPARNTMHTYEDKGNQLF